MLSECNREAGCAARKNIEKYLEMIDQLEQSKSPMHNTLALIFNDYPLSYQELNQIPEVANVHGSSIEEVENIRKQKVEKRGGFKGKVFLIEVEDD